MKAKCSMIDVLLRINDAVFAVDNSFNFTYVNQAYCDAVGFKEIELLGNNLWKALPKMVGTIAYKQMIEAMQKKEVRTFEWQGVYAPKKNWETTIYPTENGLTAITKDITNRKKTEEALKQSEKRFRVALKNSPITLIELDSDLRFKWIYNPTIGQTPEQIVGKKVGETGTVEDITPLSDFYKSVLKSGEPKRAEVKLGRFGTRAIYDIYAEPIKNREGNVTGLVTASTDITKHKRAEESLKESEERLNFATKSAHIGLWDLDLVDQTAIRSSEHGRIFGYETPTESWTLNDFLNHILPKYREPFQKIMAEAIAKRTGWSYECEIRRVDGEVRWIWVSGRLYKAPSGNDRVAGIIQDITERKEVEEALRESEERFRLVAEAAKVMVYEIQFDSDKVRVFSGEDVLGYNKGEMNGSNAWWFSQIHKDDTERVEEENKRGIASGQEYMLEYRVKRKQGDYIFVHDTVMVVCDANGNVVRLIGGLRDVTRRKQNEEAIRKSKEQLELKTAEIQKYATYMEKLAEERANKLRDTERLAAIGATAGMVGHDIRNPLQAMISDLYLLRSDLSSLPKCETCTMSGECNGVEGKHDIMESIRSLEENISYINKIVADLQDYARPITPEYSTTDLSNILVKIFEAVRVPESVKLSIKVKNLHTIHIDPILLQRALSNLVTNAIQAMPQGGTLEITGHKEEDKAIITVADTGVGIPDNVKTKLFTPMMTTKSKGQGFGLAVSKRLIEAMKGKISFESEEGKGTKFIVDLPTNL